MPDRRHAADDGRADEGEHERADERRLEHADDALVAREQARHAARRRRVDREQRARDVDHPRQHAVARHVDAVVVLRAQVERREAAVVEARGELVVAADQRGRRIAVALGLQDLVVLDAAELADRAVDRADQVGVGERPRAFLQRAGEEVVEAAVRGDVAHRRPRSCRRRTCARTSAPGASSSRRARATRRGRRTPSGRAWASRTEAGPCGDRTRASERGRREARILSTPAVREARAARRRFPYSWSHDGSTSPPRPSGRARADRRERLRRRRRRDDRRDRGLRPGRSGVAQLRRPHGDATR